MSFTERVERAKAAFVAGVATHIMYILLRYGVYEKEVAGVSFLPVHQYGKDGSKQELVGRRCVILGREGAGPFAGKLNFFGGKMSDKAAQGRGHRVATEVAVADVLFEEVYEEAGFLLEASSFLRALLDVIIRPFGDKISIMFVVNLVGFSTDKWQAMYNERRLLHEARRLDWKYVEMTEVVHVPIADLATHPEVSDYVRGAAADVDRVTYFLPDFQNRKEKEKEEVKYILDSLSSYVVVKNGALEIRSPGAHP
jgi:8-oxo-dGTP pyrophosphatase MutT (NUDIX family)